MLSDSHCKVEHFLWSSMMIHVYINNSDSDQKQFMSDEKVNILNEVSMGRKQDEEYYTL